METYHYSKVQNKLRAACFVPCTCLKRKQKTEGKIPKTSLWMQNCHILSLRFSEFFSFTRYMIVELIIEKIFRKLVNLLIMSRNSWRSKKGQRDVRINIHYTVFSGGNYLMNIRYTLINFLDHGFYWASYLETTGLSKYSIINNLQFF